MGSVGAAVSFLRFLAPPDEPRDARTDADRLGRFALVDELDDDELDDEEDDDDELEDEEEDEEELDREEGVVVGTRAPKAAETP